MRLILTALALTFALPVAAQAASFDCNRARAPDEKAVCANTALNDKDVRMSVLYEVNRRTLAMGGRGALIDAQQQWLRDRRGCGASLSIARIWTSSRPPVARCRSRHRPRGRGSWSVDGCVAPQSPTP